jgi:hypothetical protein
MLGGGYSDDDTAGAGSPNGFRGIDNHVPISMSREGSGPQQGGEDLTPLQSPGGVADDDMFANFV